MARAGAIRGAAVPWNSHKRYIESLRAGHSRKAHEGRMASEPGNFRRIDGLMEI
jgi:hypothetical protein